MVGDIQINGLPYRIDLKSYKVKDILDFAPRASVPGGSVIMSDLGMYQPLVQSDFRRGFGFHWYQDAAGYMDTTGDMDTRQEGIAMRYTAKVASDTDNNVKSGFVNFGGYLWSWGVGGLRKYDGSTWSSHSFSGIELYQVTQASASLSETLTYQHTIPTNGQNKILVVRIALRTDVTVSSVTYGGVALTQKTTVGTAPKAEIWYLLAPTAGTADIKITLSAAATILSGATSYLYVDQVNPFGTAATGSGTAALASVNVTAATGDMVIDVIAKQGPSTDVLTVDDTQTYDWTQAVDGTNSAEAAGSQEAGAATVAMSWTWTNSRAFAMIGIAIKPATQPVSGTVNFACNGGDYLFYCQSGERIRKISSGLVDSAAGLDTDSIDYAWMIMFNGLIYAGKSNSNRVHYSAEPDISDLEGTDSDISAIYVGLGSTVATKRPAVYAGSLYVARLDGLFQIGEDAVARKVVDYSGDASTNNFRSMAVMNGMLLYPIRDRVVQWNSVRVNDVTPEKINDSYPYTTYGTFNNFVSTDNFLYMTARTNESIPKEALLCYDGAGWHKLSDICIGTDTVTAMAYDATLNRIWFHLDSTNDVTYYIPMQSNSPFPYANFSTTGTHSLLSSRLDMGFRRVTKSMTSIIVEAENLSSARYISVYYQLDGDGTWTHWGDVKNNGTTELDTPGGKITREFYFVQLRFDFITDSTSQSPIFNAYTLRFIMRPDVEYGWNFNIIAASGLRNDMVIDDERTSEDIIKELRDIRNSKSPIEFVDVLGIAYTGYLTALTETPIFRRASAEDELPDIEYSVNVNIISIGE